MDLIRIIKNRRHPRDIIIAPMFTEKSSNLLAKQNSYCFKVDINANKVEIKHAIESIFSVEVKDVNTLRFKGKPKRMGRYTGTKAAWKKAIVTLENSNIIPGFEL